MLRNKQVKKLPKKTLIRFLKMFKYEKFVKYEDKIVFSIHIPPFPSKAFDRFFEAELKTRDGVKIPAVVNIAVTHKCRYNCWHCSAAPKKGKELSLETIIDAIQSFQNMGTSIFSITGGEPLLREDLTEIIRSVDDRSMVFMFTSGYGLTDEKAKELKDAGLFGMMVSLDHYKPEIHDNLRGYKGAFDIVMKGVKMAQKANLYVGLSCVITREMLQNNEVWTVLELAKNLSVHEIMMFELTPVGKLFESDSYVLNNDEREELIRYHKLINKQRKYKKYPRISVFPYFESKDFFGCTAGYNLTYIDANGYIRPCDFTPLTFGNIQEERIEDIWQKVTNVFNKPRGFCFMLENYKLVRKIGNGEYPLSYKKSLEVCKQCPPSEIPLFYKKLGIK